MSLELKITITSAKKRNSTTEKSRVRLLHKRRVKIMKTTSFVANGINYKFVICNNQWQKWERIVDGKIILYKSKEKSLQDKEKSLQ